MSNITVIYHDECDDGFGAAYAAWKKFGDAAEYIPGIYNEPAPDVTDKIVYILDYSYDRETLERMAEQAADIVILDHHKTARDVLLPLLQNGTVKGNFDTSRSGAMMAWVYFHPGIRIPRLIAYIQDHDLWRHELKSSKEVSYALNSYPMDFDVWNELMTDSAVSDLMEQGKHILRFHKRKVQEIVKNHYFVSFGNLVNIPIVNCTRSERNDVGNALAKIAPFSIVFVREGDIVRVSLRSVGSYDVSKLAAVHKGGGHKNAAGFTLCASRKAPWVGEHGW